MITVNNIYLHESDTVVTRCGLRLQFYWHRELPVLRAVYRALFFFYVCRCNSTVSDESATFPKWDRDTFSTLNIEAWFSTLLKLKQGNLDNQSPLWRSTVRKHPSSNDLQSCSVPRCKKLVRYLIFYLLIEKYRNNTCCPRLKQIFFV